MSVIQFPKQESVFQPIGQYVRLGASSYRKNSDLAAAGTLKGGRFVVEPGWLLRNKGIIRMLQNLGAEVVLDPRTIELSSRRNCGGRTGKTPWAALSPDGLLTPEHFALGHNGDVYGEIARCAVQGDVDVVIAPTHFLSDPSFGGWYEIDIEGCVQLRRALDREGGFPIRIDFMAAARLQDLEDPAFQKKLLTDLPNLPFDNLWVRAAMSSPDDGPVNARRLVRMLAGLHDADVPIIMDYMAGITGEALLALNVVAGIGHGLDEQTNFQGSAWTEPPPERDPEKRSGRGRRVSVTALGGSFTSKEMDTLLSARGAKSLLLPTDKSVLPGGIQDVRRDPRAFNAAEYQRRIEEIAAVPTAKRPDFLCRTRLREIVETRKKAAKLKPKAEVAAEHGVDLDALARRLKDKAAKSEKLRGAYEEVADERTKQGRVVKALGPLRSHRPNLQSSTGTV
jgi:hypothetical protein